MTDEFIDTCSPSECGCIGHKVSGVYHIAPCCNKPHVTDDSDK